MANNLHMGGRQLQVERAKLRDEAAVLRELKEIYMRAGKDIAEKIRIRNGRINVLLKDIDNLDDTTRSILQASIYQRDFQQGLKRQIDAFADALGNDNVKTMNDYLAKCYKNGFIGSVFDMQGQGVPLAMPIDPKKLAKASVLTPKLSRKLYGQYAGDVKQAARSEISRGIATASSYAEIARNINAQVQVGYNKAARIARTEGHRVQAESAFDAQMAARDAGADVVKQWSAALDGRTRETHMQLDGQIRELDEPFEVDGMTAMYPSDFGDPAEDINCRCALTQRARWALDDDETQHLQNVEGMDDERKKLIADKLGITPAELEKYSGQTIPIKASNYADFRKQYNKIWNYEPVAALRGRAATAANNVAVMQHPLGIKEKIIAVKNVIKGETAATAEIVNKKLAIRLDRRIMNSKIVSKSKTPIPRLPDPVTNATGVLRGKPMGIKQAASGANPLFGTGVGYSQNCQRSCMAYEMRRRGYNVEALPYIYGKSGTVLVGYEIFESKAGQLVQYEYRYKRSTLIEKLKAAPDGSRHYIVMETESKTVHMIVAEIRNGDIVYIDPQNPARDAAAAVRKAADGKFAHMRVDDKVITSKYLKEAVK